MIDFGGSVYAAGMSVPGNVSCLPLASTRMMVGLTSLSAEPRALASVTTRVATPVRGAISRVTDIGSAHVSTSVSTAQRVCRLLLEKKNSCTNILKEHI